MQIVVSGELDVATVSQLDGALRLAWASADAIVLDMRKLTFIDFIGANLIIAAASRIERSGGHLTIVSGSAELAWLLELYGVDRLLELSDTPPRRAATAAGGGRVTAGNRGPQTTVAASTR
ncbi:STAS domain-containing protein [Solirubrobacter ginsenosidimutans]|uniref:STAS domain-containing protein n=1 Tax=Solirubrobacter ginsenosidimutans TaxID=490573 RepID=A0A9X3S6V8_9ACTN|nr:STAS domain-containing protein [Solirubrobacter ginsenosidimutans]MDA0167252.1 STAS domain-containing protein [Solirubrobacter ginsenosidimutans]